MHGLSTQEAPQDQALHHSLRRNTPGRIHQDQGLHQGLLLATGVPLLATLSDLLATGVALLATVDTQPKVPANLLVADLLVPEAYRRGTAGMMSGQCGRRVAIT